MIWAQFIEVEVRARESVHEVAWFRQGPTAGDQFGRVFKCFLKSSLDVANNISWRPLANGEFLVLIHEAAEACHRDL